MLAEKRTFPKLAVLIDADNTSHSLAGPLFAEIATLGDAALRRIYGDFTREQLKGWLDKVQNHALRPYQQVAYTQGKNSSDIALVIDAMDLMHSGRFDAFCLVSSDSDFTGLSVRLREQGLDVFGFGQKKTPESFRQACSRFIFTENLSADRKTGKTSEAGKATPALIRAYSDLAEDAGAWVHLSQLGKLLITNEPDFDPRSYGFGKLVELAEATGAFQVERASQGAVRLRQKTKQHRNTA
ncbi:NYN domain-containing protein [Halovulum sp. GXIMD14793]